MNDLYNGRRATLYSATLAAALTAADQPPVIGLPACKYLALYANFTYAAGGTSADVYVQTSIDGGTTWFDIANFHFLTTTAKKMSTVVIDPATPLTPGSVPASGSLAANTVINGIIGDRIRALVTTVGVYSGATTLAIDMVAKG